MTFCIEGGETLKDQKGFSGTEIPPPVPSRTNHTTENLLWDSQVPVDVCFIDPHPGTRSDPVVSSAGLQRSAPDSAGSLSPAGFR